MTAKTLIDWLNSHDDELPKAITVFHKSDVVIGPCYKCGGWFERPANDPERLEIMCTCEDE